MKKTLKNYLYLFLTFFKIGLFTFGGGYAMIAILQDEIVTKKKWISDDDFIDMIAVSESTPGPIAINMATYIGYKTLGVLGSVFATLGVILPSCVIIYIISLFLDRFLEIEIVRHAFEGIKCAVAVLILGAGIKLFKKMDKNFISIMIFVLVFIAMFLINLFAWKFSSIYLIIIGAVIGLIVYLLSNKRKVK